MSVIRWVPCKLLLDYFLRIFFHVARWHTTVSQWKDARKPWHDMSAFTWAILIFVSDAWIENIQIRWKTFTCHRALQLSGAVWSSPHRLSSSGEEPEAQPGELNSCSHIGSTFILSALLLGGESRVCCSSYVIKIKFGIIFALYLSVCLKQKVTAIWGVVVPNVRCLCSVKLSLTQGELDFTSWESKEVKGGE